MNTKITLGLLLNALLMAGCSLFPTDKDYRPGTWELLNMEFKDFYRTGQYDRAEAVAQQSLQIAENTLRAGPIIAVSLDNFALLYQRQKQYRKAEPFFIRSLEIREKVLGPFHPAVALSLSNLGSFYQAQGMLDRAEPMLQRSATIQENALEPDYSAWAKSVESLIEIYRLANQPEKILKREQELMIVKARSNLEGEDKEPSTTRTANDDAPLPLEILVEIDPRESDELRERGIKGRVLAKSRITHDGQLRDPVIIESSDPALEKAVIEAILKHRFKPPLTKAGKPVQHTYHQLFSFGSADFDERISSYILPSKTNDLPIEFQYDKPPVIKVVAPVVYAFSLRRDDVSGSAKVAVIVDPDGDVREVTILEATHPEFGLATRGMMQCWEFEPATKDGKRTWAIFAFEQKFNGFARSTEINPSTRKILKKIKATSPDLHTSQHLDTLPVALYQPQPPYPYHLKKKGIEDTVVVQFFIDEEGAVQLPRIFKAENDELAWITLTTVSRWHFEPPLRQGKPVIARVQIPMKFDSSNEHESDKRIFLTLVK
ncbi:MAG: TonB family protein [Nitrosospira sp.]